MSEKILLKVSGKVSGEVPTTLTSLKQPDMWVRAATETTDSMQLKIMPVLYIHLLCYVLTFLSSYGTAYYSYHYSSLPMLHVLPCVSLGWSIFGLVSVGHELYHLHQRTQLQSILAALCLDLWATQGSTWVAVHNKQHHPHVWNAGEDEHLIAGNIFDNFFHTLLTLSTTYKIFQLTRYNLCLFLLRFLILVAISPYAIIVCYTVVITCVTYLTFITHAAPAIEVEQERHIIRQMQRSVDIFPKSKLSLLLWGGFNVHSAHHLSPFHTRDDLQRLHDFYRIRYPEHYCWVDSWQQLFTLYHNRYSISANSAERKLRLGLK